MARLLDADALEEAVQGAINLMESHDINMIAASVPLAIIKGAPVIAAIPVEWLKTQINEALDDNETELASDIDWLIRKYMNEQEAR